MAKKNGLIDTYLQRRSLRRWRRVAKTVGSLPLSKLRSIHAQANKLRNELDHVLFVGDNRLALPAIGSNALPHHSGADWQWRPSIWRGGLETPGLIGAKSQSKLGPEVTLFHDCKTSEISLRQIRNQRVSDLAPFGLRLEVFRFDGSFLSLALDAPQDALDKLTKRHIVIMNAIVQCERPMGIYARLNIRHGPNVETVLRKLPLNTAEARIDFDLAYTDLNDRRLEQLWVDLIFEEPEMNQVFLRDVNFSRALRADI